ncbi:glycosyl hydrolase 115 family protein [Sphingopyxis sp. CCNWLW253]|uniref:glycosyl hydrolase 115 family protein n=1 Tax=unclassified Sphingopyxis TaxID=2614943 RepID=UPI003012C3F9
MRNILGAAGSVTTLLWAPPALACSTPVSICPSAGDGSFTLIAGERPATVIVEAASDSAVRIAANGFARDLERVSGTAPRRAADPAKANGDVVIAGVLGESAAIDALVENGKLSVRDLTGRWEAYRQVVVDRPWPGVRRALIIVGADRRGAAFGLYDLSEKIGVSPLYWWADVPVVRRANLYVTAGARIDQPKVRYRGFFINDEDPGFKSWTQKQFGGQNSRAYAHVFELLLRMKGNYLWPAMWAPKAFNDDDPQNKIVADAMGVVMGTSHHEPMTRAQDEWHRDTGKGINGGAWDYASNAANLRSFWRGGIERMMSKGDGKGYESLVTVGMRGDGDEAMAEGTATQLLETIVRDQRRIIAEVTGKPADRTPQVWALYKEVQDYYDQGMRVPDDVTLLFADDNWGQIRRLPAASTPRKGGYGVYYHFDYVGGPRNYKWLNTVQIEKTWQQMDLAYAMGARDMWIVNVGDIKPVEYPLQYFMKQAWDPEAMTAEALAAYPRQWAAATFGAAQAEPIAALITRYGQLAARRKPELIDPGSFALGGVTADTLDGGEFGAMVAEWDALEADMMRAKAALPAAQRDAFFQLVEHPVLALGNLYRLYYAVAWNRKLAAAGDRRANVFADRAEAAYRRDQEIADAYHTLNGGKWDGMMLQTHIGYTDWQQPKVQTMPAVSRVAGSAGPIRFVAGPVAEVAIAIEAVDFAQSNAGKGLRWQAIPHLGRTKGAVVALPQGRGPTEQQDDVRLDYPFTFAVAGELELQLHLAPTLDVSGKRTQRIGVSIDDGPMRELVHHMDPTTDGGERADQRNWTQAVKENAVLLSARFPDVGAGRHVVRVWRLDDNVVLQRIVAGRGPIAPSYLGPMPAAAN